MRVIFGLLIQAIPEGSHFTDFTDGPERSLGGNLDISTRLFSAESS